MSDGPIYLLTGAGFSKNFGGLVASEMWSAIFSWPSVQARPGLRDRLLADQDFESVYHAVQTDGSSEDFDAIKTAVIEAYGFIDEQLMDFSFRPGSPNPVNIYKVQKLIAAFAGRKGRPGFIFTLNQDLFLERHYYNGPRPLVPGVLQSTKWFSSNFCGSSDIAHPARILPRDHQPSVEAQLEREHELAYLKLHGSCNWLDPESPDHLVIGRDKSQQIARHPLLSWYFSKFKECMNRPSARLLAIGYGFRDPHINVVLGNAVRDSGLSIYVLDPTPPSQLVDQLKTRVSGEDIVTGIRSFFDYPLRDLFPASQEETPNWTRIQMLFFQRRVS